MTDDESIAIEKIDPIEGLGKKEESYYKHQKQPPKKQTPSKVSYKELFVKRFQKNLDSFDINIVIKDGKKMFRFYSKNSHKEFFQNYDCLCELLNFCAQKEDQIGINVDINV
ncbi:hypothetical protein DESAMIL20_1699 [Desulfurella amilsii]|uniref:Uncharacterized protein n=1 Tax=Desulfurella amilsii TaxID=1562698 RepID=A0A1X4XX83_9BACT|nr:hypothetical protein [Desulfurella amilsii]OSS42146.1 hypothetical protein DESAMIL20_1699 [Desulfurella amilsii]